MLRFALIGYGTHAQWAVRTSFEQTEEAGAAKLVAVADINPDNLALAPDGVAKYDDHRKLLAEADVDAVYIATLATTHADIAVDAFAAGKHVLSEKPIADTLANAQRMVDAAAKADRMLAVDFEVRYMPGMMKIRQWVQAGRIGRVEAMHVTDMWDAHKSIGKLADRRRRLLNLAGALDCAIHKVDLARYFLGGRWSRIEALGRWFGEKLDQPPHLSVLAELDNGVLYTLNGSLAYTAHIEPKAYMHAITLVGTAGVIVKVNDRTDDTTEKIKLISSTGEESFDEAEHAAAKPIPQLIADFAKAIETGTPAPPEMATGDDGVEAQRFMELAHASAHKRRVDDEAIQAK